MLFIRGMLLHRIDIGQKQKQGQHQRKDADDPGVDNTAGQAHQRQTACRNHKRPKNDRLPGEEIGILPIGLNIKAHNLRQIFLIKRCNAQGGQSHGCRQKEAAEPVDPLKNTLKDLTRI